MRQFRQVWQQAPRVVRVAMIVGWVATGLIVLCSLVIIIMNFPALQGTP
ncbi:MAG: hypothetical protein IT326_03465 [Anaerolineae bacterium]|nr:hypothetical protein [Anaerolineae bacterium]